MVFYVVQTRKTKKSKPELTVVPFTWVKDGVVHWPRNNLITLSKDENSVVENNWFQQKCKVVGNAKSFAEGEILMARLETVTDSEDAIDMPMGTRGNPAKKKPKFVSKSYALTRPQFPPVCPSVGLPTRQISQPLPTPQTNPVQPSPQQLHATTVQSVDPVDSYMTSSKNQQPSANCPAASQQVHQQPTSSKHLHAIAAQSADPYQISSENQQPSASCPVVSQQPQQYQQLPSTSSQNSQMTDRFIMGASEVQRNTASEPEVAEMGDTSGDAPQYVVLQDGTMLQIMGTFAIPPPETVVDLREDEAHQTIQETPFVVTSPAPSFESEVIEVKNVVQGTNSEANDMKPILERLDKIEEQLHIVASFTASINKFMEMRNKPQPPSKKQRLSPNVTDFTSTFPIKTEEQLLLFDRNLAKKEYCDDVFAFTDHSYNLNGKRDGAAIFRTVMRHFVVPTIFQPFSWKGHSRKTPGTSAENRCFKDTFPNFVSLIKRIVSAADIEHTDEANGIFFSQMLRQKKTEIERYSGDKPLRQSTQARKKKVKQSDDENIEKSTITNDGNENRDQNVDSDSSSEDEDAPKDVANNGQAIQ